MAEPFVRIEGVTKTFGPFKAVDDVTLNIERAELFSLLGGSGCGKTTLLRMLAGFEAPTAGRIFIDGQDVTAAPPYARPVNMMFQSYALFPHMTVAQNVGYGLKHEAMTAAQRDDRVRDMLDLVKMPELAGRKPHQLSGGQRQRVALARALAKQPKLLLLDEPLGALDRKLREHTQFELMNIQDRTGITFIVVTHDQEEAMTLSSRIAVMDKGRILQVGTPTGIYEHPANLFTASFIGAINLFDGEVQDVAQGRAICKSAALPLPVMAEGTEALSQGQKVTLAVRPEKIQLWRERPSDLANTLAGTVSDVGYFGKDSLYRVRLPSGALVLVSSVNATRDGASAQWEDEVWLSFEPRSVIVLTE